MAKTNVKGTQVFDGTIGRADINTTVNGSAIIAKILNGNGIAMAQTGADSGTGDVTLSVDLSFLNGKYPSLDTVRTQNHVFAAPSTGNGSASFRALVAGDIPAISIGGVTNLQAALDGKWQNSGNTLTTTGQLGTLSNHNIQLIHNNTLAGTIRADGIADIKKIAVGRGPGAFDYFEGLAVFGGNIMIGGWNSPAQNSYDLNLVAYTTLDNPGNASRKNRIKFGYFMGAEFVHKYKRSIEYWRADDSLVIGSYSTVISDTSTTTPTEANSIYIASDGSTSIGQTSKESMKFLVNGAVKFKSTLEVTGNGTFSSSLYVASQLGIGTTSPTGKVEIIAGASGNLGGYAIVRTNTGIAYQGGVLLTNSILSTGYSFKLTSSFNGSSSSTARMGFVANNATETFLNSGAAIEYRYNGDILMAPSGNVGIGAINSSYKLNVNGATHITGNTIVDGSIGIGSSILTNINARISKNIDGGSTSMGIWVDGQVQSGVTGAAYNYRSNSNVVNTAFTLPDIYHFGAVQGSFGASATVTRQTGFYVGNLTGGATNYAVRTQVAAAANAWNIFADGTANNYFAGKLGIGTTTLSQANINISLPLTGSASYYGVHNLGTVQSGVDIAVYFRTNASSSTGSATNDLIHFGAYKGAFNGNVTRQYGYFVDNSLTGATNNFAFFSAIPAGSGNWGVHVAGAANNYFNGNVWIGTIAGSYKLDVNGNARFTQDVQFDSRAICNTAPTEAAHLVNKAYVDSISAIKKGESVRTISLSNISLSGTQTVNTVALVAGDLILVAGQTTSSQNGVYVVAAGAWSRSTNNDTELEIKGAYHYISAGTYANQRYINTNTGAITVDTTAITYAVDFGAETDPIWTAFKTTHDITPARIGQWNTAYTFATGLTSTNNLSEGSSNLYFTTIRVLATALAGYETGTNTALAASDTVLQAFQKLQGQVNNRLTIGGNTTGEAITIGTNDAFDFNLERNNAIQVAIKSGVVDFNYDVNIIGKIKLNNSTGTTNQFVNYDGTSTIWKTLSTDDLSDKNDLVKLIDNQGERGFQLFSDSTNTYAESFVFTNPDAGISLGLHGYSVGASDTINEFGIQFDMDGNLYHKRLNGTRSRIATVDMITGGGGGGGGDTWSGGFVSDNIILPIEKAVKWNDNTISNAVTAITYMTLPFTSPAKKVLWMSSNNDVWISSGNEIRLMTNKLLLVHDSYPVEIDLTGAYSLQNGHYARFQVSSSSGGIKKLTIVSD